MNECTAQLIHTLVILVYWYFHCSEWPIKNERILFQSKKNNRKTNKWPKVLNESLSVVWNKQFKLIITALTAFNNTTTLRNVFHWTTEFCAELVFFHLIHFPDHLFMFMYCCLLLLILFKMKQKWMRTFSCLINLNTLNSTIVTIAKNSSRKQKQKRSNKMCVLHLRMINVYMSGAMTRVRFISCYVIVMIKTTPKPHAQHSLTSFAPYNDVSSICKVISVCAREQEIANE